MRIIKAAVNYVDMLVAEAHLDMLFKFRRAADSISFIDEISVTYGHGRTFDDSVAMADLSILNIDKTLADSTNFADAIVVTWTIDRVVSDTIALLDLANTSTSGVDTHGDTTTVSDVLWFDLESPLAETATLSETFAMLAAISKAEGVSISEAIVLTPSKVLAESLSMGDNMSLLNVSIESSVLNHSVLGTFMLNQ